MPISVGPASSTAPWKPPAPAIASFPPNYNTGAHTGAVIENADFTNVWGLSEEQRYYCCAWGGSLTRETIPGGCAGIPNKLEDADIKPSQPQK